MDPFEILRRNHDIHLHSREFSDGWHSLEEVVAYGLRWQTGERWLGISEHSPQLLDATPIDGHGRLTDGQSGSIECWQNTSATSLRHCQEALRSAQPNLEGHYYARVLVGLELGWLINGIPFPQETLNGFDYILAAYHGREIHSLSQAKEFLFKMINHPLTVVLAHPDAFLGEHSAVMPGPMAGVWRAVFQHMAELGVLCEYNLNTPLKPEVFRIARDESGMKFVIGSDLHDFRQLSTRRIMDAWSESQGGGFTEAQEYLLTLIEQEGGNGAVDSWHDLFAAPEALDQLENKIYTRTRRYGARDVLLSPSETSFVCHLDEIPEGRVDLEFQAARLRRFASLAEDRIASTLGVGQFLELVRYGWELRKSTLRRQG